MTYPEALQYLNSFINYEKQDGYSYQKSFNLERMKRITSLIGDPQKGIRSVHIAGTKGKGSTCAIVHSILKSAGFKVGLYTSPHLVSFRERIKIGDSLITEEEVSALVEKIRPVVAALDEDATSFFEVYTALAYLYFSQKKVDFAVYETGLGGRLDATNVLEPLVCAITPISYEHTDKLGHTLGEIAYEKGGIIKEDTLCVVAPQEASALAVIKRICEEKNTRLILVGKDILFEELGSKEEKEFFNVLGLFGEYPLLGMGLLGSHQILNAATAIGIVEALRFHDITISSDAIRKGLEVASWPGRFEIVARSPDIVLDGAQNAASANALAETVRKVSRHRRLILILGISKDKDISGILKELVPISDIIILTKSNVVERAADPSSINELIRSKKKNATLTSNVKEALERARTEAAPEDLILITGSLFVVGEARALVLGEKS